MSQYASKDVFNMDETALFYCSAPNTTIAPTSFKGIKDDKSRLTVVATVNALGQNV